MSKYIQNGKVFNYKVSFLVDGNFVSPTSANITLTDNAGNIINGINGLTLTIPANATSVVYSFSGSDNTASLVYELRYVTIEFVYNSQTYYINDFYTLRESLRIPVTPDDVRQLLGLSTSELSDEQIDIYAAFDETSGDVDSSLNSFLDSGSVLIPYVQQAIQAKAALNAMTMIETMIFQSEQADNTLYKRFTSIDFNAILDRLSLIYNNAILKLNGVASGDTPAVLIFTVVTGTDPVTGS